MKILQVNCVYKKGSTGKITFDLHKGLLDEGIDSVVCYGRGSLIKEDYVYKICSEWYSRLNNALSRISGVMYGGCYLSTNKVISIIKKEKPDVVHLQCINGYFVNIYRLVDWLKVNHIRTVLTLHAEFMYTGGCGYAIECKQWCNPKGCGQSIKCPRWRSETGSMFFDGTSKMWKKMKDAFEGFDENLLITSVSPWLMNRAKSSLILGNKRHKVVYNGLDTSVFHPYIRTKNDTPTVFHASPAFIDDPTHIKGGYYILELAKRMPNVNFVIAGNHTINGEVPNNVTLLGSVMNQARLAKLYSDADLTVIASKRETFSMICAESLCCGTPIVGFKAGAPEQISLSEYSEFVEYGDIDGLESVVKKWLDKPKSCEIAKNAAIVYDKKVMVQRYIDLYIKLKEGRL